MRSIKEILRLHFEHRLSFEKIAAVTKVSKGTIANKVKAFNESGLKWPLGPEVDDHSLQQSLYPQTQKQDNLKGLDFNYIFEELQKPHVTLQLLWEEYHKDNPQGFGRSAYYNRVKAYQDTHPDPTMRQAQKAGEKLFVDYSGDGSYYTDPVNGKQIRVELFVASWGASSMCYAEATKTQGKEDFVMSHVRAFEYFGSVPWVVVPDNLKSGVIKPSYYEPELNPLYQKMCEHYGLVCLPARVRKPGDKAVVESNVLHIQRFILGRMRNRQFFSLEGINQFIKQLLDEFNSRPMKDHQGKSRRERFEQLDKVHAREICEERFLITSIEQGVRVGFNYHVKFDDHHYSVPHEMVKKRVDIHQVGQILEIYCEGRHVCRHKKGPEKGEYTTIDSHMPPNHQAVKAAQNPSWHIFRAGEIGPATSEVTKCILNNRKHPEQAFRSCMGLISLAKKYSPKRLESSCERALYYKCSSYKAVKSILEQNLDSQNWKAPDDFEIKPEQPHENIRGAQYYSSNSEEV